LGWQVEFLNGFLQIYSAVAKATYAQEIHRISVEKTLFLDILGCSAVAETPLSYYLICDKTYATIKLCKSSLNGHFLK
jgi:hypothetical protein